MDGLRQVNKTDHRNLQNPRFAISGYLRKLPLPLAKRWGSIARLLEGFDEAMAG